MSRPVNTVLPQQVVATVQSAPLGFTVNPLTGQTFRVVPAKNRSNDYIRLQRDYDTARANLVRQMRDSHLTYNISNRSVTDRDGRVVVEPEEVRRLRSALDSAKTALKQYKSANAGEFAPTRRGTAQSRALQRRRRFERLVDTGRLVLNRATGRYEKVLSQPIVAANPTQGVEQKVRSAATAVSTGATPVTSLISYSSALTQSSTAQAVTANLAVQNSSGSASTAAKTSNIVRFPNPVSKSNWADDDSDDHERDESSRLDSVESSVAELKLGMDQMVIQLSQIAKFLQSKDSLSTATNPATGADGPLSGPTSSSSSSSHSDSTSSKDDVAPKGT